MKYKSFDTYIRDEGEPVWRSCPRCNQAHAHLLDATSWHECFVCGASWMHGRFFDEFETAEALDAWLSGVLEHVNEP